MPICPICDDSGLQNSDPAHPQFCFCAAGKQARREWETAHAGRQEHAQQESRRQQAGKQTSFIDIERLEEVNASVDAMRAALIGEVATETGARVKPSAVLLLYQVAHAGHEVSIAEATQLYELAKALEGFLTALAPIGRKLR
jgi:multidrug resistance efflux pump